MSEAIRTYKQYIELNVVFDDEKKAKEVWPTLYENDLALKCYSNDKFHYSNFTGNRSKKVISVTSLLADAPHYMDTWPSGTTQLMNKMIGIGRWEKTTLTVPNDNIVVFRPNQFAISERVFIGTDLSSWYDSEDIEFFHDLRYAVGGRGESANLYNFTVESTRSTGTGCISGLTFKILISSNDQALLDGCEDLVNDLVLNTIVKACAEVGPITHSLSCRGEIEVEKAVSCNRFSVPESESEEE